MPERETIMRLHKVYIEKDKDPSVSMWVSQIYTFAQETNFTVPDRPVSSINTKYVGSLV